MFMICVWFGKGLRCFGFTLDIMFLTHGVMDAFKIVYPQHWLRLDCEHHLLNTIKQPFDMAKSNGWMSKRLWSLNF
jgi:hypothetical protein